MKLFGKMKSWIHNFIVWATAILICAIVIFVPITVVAWCIEFWVTLIR